MAKPNFKSRNQQQKVGYRINEEITGVYECRITGEGITSEVVPFRQALKLAESMEMDLIEINSSITPPIMRIAPYDKFLYQVKKNAKSKQQQPKPLKEIQLSVNIASNDLNTKAKKAKEFIEDGSKVKVVLTMKGRELLRREDNKKVIFEFITLLEDVAVPESMPKDEGNRTSVILKVKNKKKENG